MFRVKVTQPTATILAIRTLPVRAQREFRRELQTQVKPEIEKDVQELVAPYPGPVVSGPDHPFEFATDKSRRFYFATLGKRGPYVRSKQLFQSWTVRIGSQIRADMITILNLKSYSKFVYGPRQVPGHRRTGWGGPNFQAGLDLTREHARQLVVTLWRRVVIREAKT